MKRRALWKTCHAAPGTLAYSIINALLSQGFCISRLWKTVFHNLWYGCVFFSPMLASFRLVFPIFSYYCHGKKHVKTQSQLFLCAGPFICRIRRTCDTIARSHTSNKRTVSIAPSSEICLEGRWFHGEHRSHPGLPVGGSGNPSG